MESQSHKRGSLCSINPREKEFVDSEFAHGHVNKLLLEVVIDLGLNPPQVFTLKLLVSLVFLNHHIMVFFIFHYFA